MSNHHVSTATVSSPVDYSLTDPEVALTSTPSTSSRSSHTRHQPQVPIDVDDDDFGSASVPINFDATDGTFNGKLDAETEIFTSRGTTSIASGTLVEEWREDSVTSMLSGDNSVQVKQGPSKKPTLSKRPLTPLARANSNEATYYI
jgi:hypothetical protein